MYLVIVSAYMYLAIVEIRSCVVLWMGAREHAEENVVLSSTPTGGEGREGGREGGTKEKREGRGKETP